MNLKKLLSTLGIISATITGSLNIVACNNTKSNNKNDEQLKTIENEEIQIEDNYENKEVSALNIIKKTNFSITIPKGTEVAHLYNLINAKFIISELSDDLKNALNLSEFKLQDITIKQDDLINNKVWLFEITAKDLNIETVLKTKINFSYKDKNYEVPLTINIISRKEILDKDILEITKNAIVLKNKEQIKISTDGKINILSDEVIAKYIAESVNYIDFHKEPNYSNIISTADTQAIKDIIKISMRNYFEKNDKSLIKNIFNPKDLKIKSLYIIKDNKMKLLTSKDLSKIQEIIVEFKYKNIRKYSKEIILNSIDTILRDQKNNEAIFYVPS